MDRLYAVGNGVDEVLGIYDDSGETQYLHSNHVGSVTGVTDESGSIAGEKDYTPFGLARDMSGEIDRELGFIGRKQYEEIGLTYIRARFYDPASGRFITKDPVRDGFNWYSYCGANPVGFVDRSGKWGDNIHYGSDEYGGTYQWAIDQGFSPWEAEIIGKANFGIDKGLLKNPITGDQGYHFNTNSFTAEEGSIGDSRMIRANHHLTNAIHYEKLARTCNDPTLAAEYHMNALKELGKGLHPLQDISAHKDEYVHRYPTGNPVFGSPKFIYSHLHTKEPDQVIDKYGNIRDSFYECKETTYNYFRNFFYGVNY